MPIPEIYKETEVNCICKLSENRRQLTVVYDIKAKAITSEDGQSTSIEAFTRHIKRLRELNLVQAVKDMITGLFRDEEQKDAPRSEQTSS